MKKKPTRQDYEEYLNEIQSFRGEHKKYGTWLRRNDPIAFNVGYNEYLRERNKF